jgi:hypothetical protein
MRKHYSPKTLDRLRYIRRQWAVYVPSTPPAPRRC